MKCTLVTNSFIVFCCINVCPSVPLTIYTEVLNVNICVLNIKIRAIVETNIDTSFTHIRSFVGISNPIHVQKISYQKLLITFNFVSV
ncbi:Uncharacterised protein [Klebsiella pneumoniae]|nr:Uncharacterised protein [Klebsiella pneumoniae]